ncbi:tyrosine-type recombinase/integrase, partial [Enterocloster hominis (ex Hitch et al. 2024)]
HNLRHLFAYTYYGVDKDLVHLADILGHSSVETTRIYTISTGEEQQEAMQKMEMII